MINYRLVQDHSSNPRKRARLQRYKEFNSAEESGGGED